MSDLLREFATGRIGIVRSMDLGEGSVTVEFSGGVETVPACDTQVVGPDPDAVEVVEAAREWARCARENAATATDEATVAHWLAEAKGAEREAAEVWAGSMEWLNDPIEQYRARRRAEASADDTDGW